MALTKPLLYTPPAFDATQPYTFTFNVIGGDRVVANQLTIIDQSTNDIVYQQKISTRLYSHTLQANSINNNGYYSAYIITYNSSDESSVRSDLVQFNCLSTPTWRYINIPSDGIIDSSSYTFKIEYDHDGIESLSDGRYELYDYNKNVIDSHFFFISPHAPIRTVLEQKESNMFNGGTYYVRATGTTENGMKLDTGFIRILPVYIVPIRPSVVTVNNNCSMGNISINVDAVDINGQSNPSPPIYVMDNTAVQLQSNVTDYIKWEENLILGDNYRVIIWARDIEKEIQVPSDVSRELIVIKDEDNLISIYLNEYPLTESPEKHILKGYIYNTTQTQLIDTVETELELSENYFLLQQIIISKNNGEYSIEWNVLESINRSAILGTAVIGMMELGNNGEEE